MRSHVQEEKVEEVLICRDIVSALHLCPCLCPYLYLYRLLYMCHRCRMCKRKRCEKKCVNKKRSEKKTVEKNIRLKSKHKDEQDSD